MSPHPHPHGYFHSLPVWDQRASIGADWEGREAMTCEQPAGSAQLGPQPHCLLTGFYQPHRGHTADTRVPTRTHMPSQGPPGAPGEAATRLAQGQEQNRGKGTPRVRQKGRLLPSTFIGASAKRDIDQEPSSTAQSTRLGRGHREPNSFVSRHRQHY